METTIRANNPGTAQDIGEGARLIFEKRRPRVQYRMLLHSFFCVPWAQVRLLAYF